MKKLAIATTVFLCFVLNPLNVFAAEVLQTDATLIELTQSQKGGIEPYSWYGEPFSIVSGTKKTAVRYFDGSSVGLEMTSSATIQGTFSVSLYREGGTLLGARQLKFNGFSKVTWSNVGSGRYFFSFTKTTAPSVKVTTSQLKMYSW